MAGRCIRELILHQPFSSWGRGRAGGLLLPAWEDRGVVSLLGLRGWGAACLQPFRSAGGPLSPLAKMWSSCRAPLRGGRAANQKQTDRPCDCTRPSAACSFGGSAGAQGSRSSLPSTGCWALWEALTFIALSHLRSPGERGSGRPSGLSGRRSHSWEQVVLGLTPRLTAKLLLFPLPGPVLPTA